jgi:hypothetical protein
MGLDQYAYSAARAGQWDDYHAEWNRPERSVAQPRELAYWRKHPNLHGWFRALWNEKGNSGSFNGDELELTWNDLDRLEQAVRSSELPGTEGFFFGDSRDDEYRDQDLEFVRTARAELFLGLKVFYNSSW